MTTITDHVFDDARLVLAEIERQVGRATQSSVQQVVLPMLPSRGQYDTPTERWARVWSSIELRQLVQYDSMSRTIALTPAGRNEIEGAPPPQPERKATYREVRAAYLASLEGRKRSILQQQIDYRQQRYAAHHRGRGVLTDLVPTWNTAWRVQDEPASGSPFGYCVRPNFSDGPDPDVYIRVIEVDDETGVIWLQSSCGGEPIAVWRGMPSRQTATALAQAYCPMVDPSVPGLPTFDDPEGQRSARERYTGPTARTLEQRVAALEAQLAEMVAAPLQLLAEKKEERIVDGEKLADVLLYVRINPGSSRRDVMRAQRLTAAAMDQVESQLEESGEIRVQRVRVPGGERALYFPVANGWTADVSQVSHEASETVA